MHIDNVYYSIFMNAVEGIFQSTPDGQYLNVNPSLAKMYGYDSPSELMRSVNNIAAQLYVNPDRRQQFIDEMTKNGIVKDFVSQIYRKDKSKIWITENVRIVRDENGQALYYEGFVSDITPLVKVQERNKNLQNRLQQAEKMETIGTMANGIAHDFSNILTPIIGYAELLTDFVPPQDPIANFVDRIVVSARRGKDLVKQIHAFGQPDPESCLPISITGIIQEILVMLGDTTPRTINLSHDLPPKLPMIMADATQIHQILLNLCTNSIHAMEENGGELLVKLRSRHMIQSDIDRKLLRITPGCYLQVYVKDNGTGMPPEVQKKIFDPYFTTKGKGKGTGLGLATVHSIVKNYKGEIVVKSTPGKGTTFVIYLPAMAETVKSVHVSPQVYQKTEQPGKHIMLVDDDADVLQVQAHLLKQLGYVVSMFKDGFSALQSFEQNPHQYDMVLTDFNMPEMTGLDLSKSLLNIRSGLPIILCTGFKGSIDEPTTKAAGIRELMFKPLTKNNLDTRMQALFQLQKVTVHN